MACSSVAIRGPGLEQSGTNTSARDARRPGREQASAFLDGYEAYDFLSSELS